MRSLFIHSLLILSFWAIQGSLTKAEDSTDDSIRPNAVFWNNRTIYLRILERQGNTFRARYEGNTWSWEIKGTINGNKISWLAKDSQVIRENKNAPASDNFGTVSGDRIDYSWTDRKGSGTRTLVRIREGNEPSSGKAADPKTLEEALLLYSWSWIDGEWKADLHFQTAHNLHTNREDPEKPWKQWQWWVTGPLTVHVGFSWAKEAARPGLQPENGADLVFDRSLTRYTGAIHNKAGEDITIYGSRLALLSAPEVPNKTEMALSDSNANPLFAPVPDAAQRAIEGAASGQSLSSVDRIDDNGVPVYRATITSPNGDARDITVTADGGPLGRQLFPTELSAALQHAITAYAVHDSVESVDQLYDTPEMATFQVTLRTGSGQSRQLLLDESGGLVTREVTLEEVPDVVRTRLVALAGASKIESIDRTLIDTETTYQVRIRNGQKRPRLSIVGNGGELLSTQIDLSDVPDSVRKTVQEEADQDPVTVVDQVYEDGAVYYYVGLWHRRFHHRHGLVLAADGRLLRRQVSLVETQEKIRLSIRNQFAGERLLWLGKVYEPGTRSFHYEAHGWSGGHPQVVHIEEGGKVITAPHPGTKTGQSQRVALSRAFVRHSQLHSGGHASAGRRR